MAADVFVSYARIDREQVLPWVQQLQHAGVSLWIDEAGIDGAHLWTQEITEAIQGCRVLAVMLSPAAVASEHVVREVTLALQEHRRILPLLLEPVDLPSTLRYPLAGLQQIELFKGDPEAKRVALVRALVRLGVSVQLEDVGASTSTSEAGGSPRNAPSRPRHNLPRALSRFIGREAQIRELKALLRQAALLTVTGIGGLGKTRLALQVAAEVVPDYLDGVWLVELAALSEPSLVPQEVAAALSVWEEPGRPLIETLIDALQPRQTLLVLDNCEHLIGACAALAQRLLQSCRDLRILATSREALSVPGERLVRVPTLVAPVPPPPPLEQLAQYEAVQLFMERALLAQPAFLLAEANAPAVAAICHRLDGIPLAIELAAARMRMLSVEQIMTRLGDRFRLLVGGSRTALPRFQTLRATLDWSYDLLPESERALLRRLTVFAGGWTLPAAEAVCTGEGIGEEEILDLLGQLIDKSLVVVDEHDGEVRYRLLESIRQYGAEKLQGAGESARLRRRHGDFFLSLAESAEPELKGPQQGLWFDRLESEHDNMRTALSSAEASGEAAVALRLGRALWQLWWIRGYLTEGRERLAHLLTLSGASACMRERAKALHGAGILACDQGDYQSARTHHAESLAIRRELDDRRGIAASLNNLGHVARLQGDYSTARALYEESLEIARAQANKRDIAFSLNGLGMVARYQSDYPAAWAFYEESLKIGRELQDQGNAAILLNNMGLLALDQGDYPAAQACYEQSLAIKQKLGDKRGIAFSLNGLGLVAYYQGDHTTARSLFEESLSIRRELGDRRGIAFSLTGLGDVALHRGDCQAARDFHEESLSIRRELGEKPGIPDSLHGLGEVSEQEGDDRAAWALYGEALSLRRALGSREGIARGLEGLARVAAMQGRPEQAVRLLASAAAQRDALGAAVPPVERRRDARHRADLCAALGEEAFAAAWEAGRAMSPDDSVAFGLEDPDPGCR